MSLSRAKEPVRLRDVPEEWKRVSWYRAAIDIGLVWSGIVALVTLSPRSHSVLAVVLALPFVAALQNHLSSLFHHAIHVNLHPDRRVNDWMARLFTAAPLGLLFGALRREHVAHHARLGAADDPERFYYDLERHGRGTRRGFIRWLATLLLAGWVILPAVRRAVTGRRDEGDAPGGGLHSLAERRERLLDVALVPPVQAVIALLFWRLSGAWWSYPALWVLPAVTLGGGLTALRATIEHADTGRPPRISMSFESNPIERFFVGPLAFNYHYEHHRFMTVPYYHVAGVRRLLREHDDYDGALIPSYCGRIMQLIRSLPTAGPHG
jgi:fatty acid desaturase